MLPAEIKRKTRTHKITQLHSSHTPHQEPEEIFLPLEQRRYAEFYSMEMDGFQKDIAFYQQHISDSSSVLELGCGTGRISHALSSAHNVVGLDLSFEMLEQARQTGSYSVEYVCMDMTRMAFGKSFDHILVPYNTLNLLQTESQISACLKQIHSLLRPGGTLHFQIYIPGDDIRETGNNKLFQFQMFPLSGNSGKLIKESIRTYDFDSETIQLEERYRVRPAGTDAVKEDLHHILTLAGFRLEKWLSILKRSHFSNLSLYGDYDSRPFRAQQDSLLLIKANS